MKPAEREPKGKPGFEVAPAPGKKVRITDVALRDGHQSLLATRMRTEDMLPVAEQLPHVARRVPFEDLPKIMLLFIKKDLRVRPF